MKIYSAHNKYFLPINNGLKEVTLWQVVEWQRLGVQIEIVEGEQID
jgi:hypothetical protein